MYMNFAFAVTVAKVLIQFLKSSYKKQFCPLRMKAVTKLNRRLGRIFTFVVIYKNKQIEISCLYCGWMLVLSLDLTIMWM